MKQWLEQIAPTGHRSARQTAARVRQAAAQDPSLGRFNRRSVAGTVALGLFVMYLPPLRQVLIAAAGAIVLRVNLPISVALIWITNPVTIPPMYYFSYRVGFWILGMPAQSFCVEYWLEWRNWLDVLAPLTVGGLVCGGVCSALGYFAVRAVQRQGLEQRLLPGRRR